MAEETEGGVINKQENVATDDVFVNGDNDSAINSNLLTPDYSSIPKQLLPRRSSLVKDRSHKKERKKTVSFSSMPNEKTVVNAPDCLNCMQNGSELIKVRSNSRQYHRMFTLNQDCTEVRWHPSSKKPSKARIAISEIKEVRSGKNTEVLRNKDIAGHYPDECAFSVIYGDGFDSMDLIANSPDEASIWLTGLTCLISKNKGAPETLEDRQQHRDQWLRTVFDSGNVDHTGQIDEIEVMKLVKQLNTGLTTDKIQQKLKEVAHHKEGQRGRLDSSEFIALFKEISTRPEIYFLLVRYASSADFLTTDDLTLFLEAEQGMTRVTKEKCLEIINKYEPSTEGRKMAHLGIDGFTAFLLSTDCDIFDRAHRSVCQDMTQPLSHYFIASSHKTYLLEDQLKGPSSTEGYVQALKRGCRYIELDVWDGQNDDPMVYHGHTLTSKVPLKSVIETINEYAFVTSQYPVILSIGTHCSIKQQETAVKYLHEIFGEKLCVDKVQDDVQFLPSPNEMRNQIIIKNKKLLLSVSEKSVENEEDESCGYVTEEDESESDRSRKNHKREGSVKKIKLAKELSDLVIYCKALRFEDFQTSVKKQKYNEMCSFSESTALKLTNACPEDFVNHNKKFLSKVYPNGMRVDSSNFNPEDLWNCGCQIVALNYQTSGLMIDLNNGRFLANGGCGYVLKPAVMREEIAYFSANTREVIPGVSPQILHIKVISGQQLPKPKGAGARGDTVDPYVTVEIFGIPSDCAEERTKTIQHNGYNPIFDESFEFQINLPELALVRFAVLDDEFIGDEFIGQYTIPFACMQTGYRHVRLTSNSGEEIPNCSLFVHIAIANRYGGGKSRRGMTMRKSKKKSDYPSMKSIGIKPIDESFKNAIPILKEETDLRDSVQVALATFRQHCGASAIANIKQCIRVLASRIQTSCEGVQLCLTVKNGWPKMEAQGNLPDVLRKALSSFEVMVTECKNLIETANEVHDKLIAAQKVGMELHEELQPLAVQQGLKGKKLNKAMENFVWNVRILKGQADLLNQAAIEAKEYILQMKEAGYFFNPIEVDTGAENDGGTYSDPPSPAVSNSSNNSLGLVSGESGEPHSPIITDQPPLLPPSENGGTSN